MHEQSHDQLSGSSAAFSDFVGLISILRSPEGCPWDREQTHQSLTPHMLEEAFEAVDAIETGDTSAIREELGDVLLQVVLHAQIAAEAGDFDIEDVIRDIYEKIYRRHPHVFAEAELGEGEGSEASKVVDLWAELKRSERSGLYDSLSYSQPALMLASDVSKKAVSSGFEWPDIAGVRAKLSEELAELEETQVGSDEAFEEIGDVLFTAVNLARKYKVNPEQALRANVRKFTARWGIMERYASELGRELSGMSLDEQEELWQKAKQELKNKES